MESKIYKTKDLGEASAFLANNAKLTEIERHGSICWFVFQDGLLCSKLSNQYFFGELLINARTYYEATMRLKNRIFNT